MPGRSLTTFRERRQEILDKVYLVFRPDNTPDLLRPVRSLAPSRCSGCGSAIHVNEYSYRCHEAPIRLTSNGRSKCCVKCVEIQGRELVAVGYEMIRLPTTEKLFGLKGVKEAEAKKRKELEKEATKLLRRP